MARIIATIGIIQGMAIGVGIVRSKTVAVLLGPQGVGVVSMVDQVIQLITYVSAFSLPFAAVKFLSRAHSKGFDTFQRSYASLLRLLLLLASGGMVVSLAAIFWRPALLGPELSAYHALLVPALIGLPFMVLHGFFSNVLAAAQKTRASALMALAIALCFAMTTYVGISLGGILGLYWGNLLAGVFVVGGVLAYLRKTLHLPLRHGRLAIREELRENPDLISFSLILYATSFLYSFAYFVARYAVLAGFGEREAGLLQAAIALAGALNLVLNPANGLYLTPILNRNIARAEKRRAALEFQRKLTLITAVLAMPLVLFPQWLVVLFYSPSFVEVSNVIFLFVVAQYIAQLAGVYQALIIGLDDLKAYGVIVAIGHLSFAALSWLLVLQHGIPGVAIALLISTVGTFLLTMGHLTLKHGLAVPAGLRFSMGYGLLALLTAGATLGQTDAWHPLGILGKFALYCLFLASLLFFLRQEERRELDQLSHRFFSGVNRKKCRYAVGHTYRRIAKTFFVRV